LPTGTFEQTRTGAAPGTFDPTFIPTRTRAAIGNLHHKGSGTQNPSGTFNPARTRAASHSFHWPSGTFNPFGSGTFFPSGFAG